MSDVFRMVPGLTDESLCMTSSMFGSGNKHAAEFKRAKRYPMRIEGGGLNIRIDGETAKLDRLMVLCEKDDGQRISYLWCDSVTGSLFHPATGKCLSSSTLRIAIKATKSARGAIKAGRVIPE